MSYRKLIESSKAFTGLEQYKKNIYQTGANIKNLSEQYVIAKNTGYDTWKAGYSPNVVEDKIIKELVNPQQ
jgi:hypothetical protein